MGEDELEGAGSGRSTGFDYGQLVGPGIGAGAAFLGSIPQIIEANRLRKERQRLMKEGAPGFTPMEQEQIAAARSRAASSNVPGYAQELENISQQQADILAAGKRGSATSSNLLNLLSKLNIQGQAARRNLAMRGAQAQRAAQSELANLSLTADARRMARVQNWEAQMAAMDAARRQYNAQAGIAPLQGALAFMPLEGFKYGTKLNKGPEVEPIEPRYSASPDFNVEYPNGQQMPFRPMFQYGGVPSKVPYDANYLKQNPMRNTAIGTNRYNPY